MTKSMQDHAAAATGTDPNVQYAYEDGIASNEAKYVRPDYVTYPGPGTRRVVYYNYPTSGVGAALSRLSNIAPISGSHFASYMYLGAGTMVDANYPAVTNTPALTYGSRANNYSGLDRFGRVVEQKWAAGATVKDQFKYGYDRASNRLYRTNELNHDLDELYHANGPSGAYDGLDRLTGFRRGVLSDTNSDGVPDTVATVSRIQEWTLDPVGNWSGYKSSATTQSWDLDQGRLHNKANEIEDTGETPNAISGTPDWIDPAYDLAGNMTAGPQPRYETADANTQLYKYDAWNRLTKIYRDANCNDTIDDPSELVVTYSYDGQNRRIRKVVAGDDTYDYYYNENWQVLEVCKASRTNKTYQQYVWGIQYVDAPVVQFRAPTDSATLSETLYYTYDGNFNVTGLIGTNGTVAERYTYDPYGQVTFKDADWSDAASQAKSAYDNEILYCGYRFDPESGLYHVNNRYLHPPLGRWITTDPIVHGDGMNWYQYVGGRPTVAMDPEGLFVDPSIVFPPTQTPPKNTPSDTPARAGSSNQGQTVAATKGCCGPELDTWLINQINTNRNHKAIKQMHDYSWAVAIPFFGVGWGTSFLVEFKNLVKPGGPWDFKVTQSFTRAGCPTTECRDTVTICGICFYKDVPGNIHYGYMARYANLREWVIYAGAASVAPSFDDELVDRVAISIGIEMANSSASLCSLVEAKKDQLSKTKTEGCVPCKTKY